MLIGLDGLPLTELKTGVGHYTFELACALARVAPADEFELVSPLPYLGLSETDRQTMPANLRAAEVKVNIIWRRWWTVGLPSYLKRRTPTLFHGTNFEVPLRGHVCPTVLTIHDLSLFLHADTHLTRRVIRAYLKMPLMARAATMIITPTETVRLEVAERLHVDPYRIVAVPEAPRNLFRPLPPEETLETRKRLGVEDEFLLFVGTIEPRKNLLTLMHAYEEVLRQTSHQPQLVIAGKKGWMTDDLPLEAEKTGIGKRLCWTGYVSDEDLRALYSSCRAFIYPSVYEGFGLPPLEAMACGAPVITSRIPSIAESTEGAAKLVSPTDADALAESIIHLLEDEDERRYLSTAGLNRATEFSWEQTARLTLEVYREAIRRTESEEV